MFERVRKRQNKKKKLSFMEQYTFIFLVGSRYNKELQCCRKECNGDYFEKL